MPRIRVQATVAAPREAVWARLADIGDHVTWMADAAAIRFESEQRTGVGTTFECETRLGPLRTLDIMQVTSWREPTEIGVRHRGLFTGVGRFRLAPAGPDRTRVLWEEDLHFPWWLGGPVGATLAAPVLAAVWRGNLRRLATYTTRKQPA